jgi:inorganic pyrophosphatase
MPDATALAHKLDPKAATCRAVVETPRGSRFKFNFDPKTQLYCVKSLLPEGMSFPLDFGFIPSTRAEDGDPLDVMILAEAPLAVGVVVEARLIGVIEAEETEDGQTYRNDRLLATPSVSRLYAKVRGPDDLSETLVQHLCEFWTHKGRLEGKQFRMLAVGDRAAAVEQVRKAAKARKGGRPG